MDYLWQGLILLFFQHSIYKLMDIKKQFWGLNTASPPFFCLLVHERSLAILKNRLNSIK